MKLLGAVKGTLFGAAIGDALGVPVEFMGREQLRANPVTGPVGYGVHEQPLGTFSDDASMTFCLAEALAGDFTPENVAKNFIAWVNDAYWTAGGNVFDIGRTTFKAINNLYRGVSPESAGGKGVHDNGNGSLMRISPLVFYIRKMPIRERFDIIQKVSSMTHGHIRSVIACFYYLEFMGQLLDGKDMPGAYKNLQMTVPDFLSLLSIDKSETGLFDRLLVHDIQKLPEDQIQSSGYVLHTLEAAIWCLLTTDNYMDAVLKAVNLGDDTDTTGCVTGAVAGLYYGFDGIREEWVDTILKRDEISDLAERLYKKQCVSEPQITINTGGDYIRRFK